MKILKNEQMFIETIDRIFYKLNVIVQIEKLEIIDQCIYLRDKIIYIMEQKQYYDTKRKIHKFNTIYNFNTIPDYLVFSKDGFGICKDLNMLISSVIKYEYMYSRIIMDKINEFIVRINNYEHNYDYDYN